MSWRFRSLKARVGLTARTLCVSYRVRPAGQNRRRKTTRTNSYKVGLLSFDRFIIEDPDTLAESRVASTGAVIILYQCRQEDRKKERERGRENRPRHLAKLFGITRHLVSKRSQKKMDMEKKRGKKSAGRF